MRFISIDQHHELKKGHLKKNDILVTTRGDIGQVAIVPAQHIGSNINAQIVRINTATEGIDHRFFAYTLVSAGSQGQLKELQTGSALKQLPVGRLIQLQIPIPSPSEQCAIAESLTDADALIESLEQLLAKKRQLKQGAMQELLTGKKRLPGFRGEWEVRPLGRVASLYQPQTISQSNFTSDGFPVYGANGIIGRYIRYNHDTSQITISCRGNCGTVNKTEDKSWITGNAMVVNCDQNDGVDKQFLYYLLSSQDFSVLVTGSGQPQIVRGPLSEFEIFLPPNITEQIAIATILSDMDAEIAMLEEKLSKASNLKQGMMQELLTGRIRLV